MKNNSKSYFESLSQDNVKNGNWKEKTNGKELHHIYQLQHQRRLKPKLVGVGSVNSK